MSGIKNTAFTMTFLQCVTCWNGHAYNQVPSVWLLSKCTPTQQMLYLRHVSKWTRVQPVFKAWNVSKYTRCKSNLCLLTLVRIDSSSIIFVQYNKCWNGLVSNHVFTLWHMVIWTIPLRKLSQYASCLYGHVYYEKWFISVHANRDRCEKKMV